MKGPVRRKIWLRALGVLLASASLLVVIGLADAWADLGTKPAAARLERMAKSPQYRGGKFVDTIPRVEPDIWAATKRWMVGTPQSQPSSPPPIVPRTTRDFDAPSPSGLRITWFGHSSLLVEIDGRRVLVDPVWSERCSPSRFMGPKR